MLVAIGFMAFLMLVAVFYFTNPPMLVSMSVLAIAAVALATYTYIDLALTPEERVALLRRVHLLPDAPPDMVSLTGRCARLIEDSGKFPSGTLNGLGAPMRQTNGSAWTVTWTASERSVVPAGAYGCAGEALSIRSVVIAGETSTLPR